MICILPLRNIRCVWTPSHSFSKISRNSSEPSRSEAESSTESDSLYFDFCLKDLSLLLSPFSLSPCVCVHTHAHGVSQVVLVVKNPPANAGDIRDTGSIPGLGRASEDGMATHSSILSWRMPMNIGAWWAMAHRVA